MDEAARQRLTSTHFSLDNLRQANELILNFTRQLRLREAFRFPPFAVLSYRHLNLHGEYDFSVQVQVVEAPRLTWT